MDKVIEALKGNVRVNASDNTVEVYDEYGVHMKLHVDEATMEAFKSNFQTW